MSDFALKRGSGKSLTRLQLIKLKHRAIRAGAWFRALPRIDRVLVDLTIKVAQNIRSCSLARSVLFVARKLERFLEGKVARTIREFGFSLAIKLSMLAQSWGNRSCGKWSSDRNFAQYLAIMKLNSKLL